LTHSIPAAPLHRAVLSAFLLLYLANSASVLAQCTGGGTPTATIELVSPPFAQFSSQIQLSEYYNSAADIGTAQAIITGNHIDITQTTSIAPSPTLTCRVQVLDLGMLPPGRYDVTWTTTENNIAVSAINIRIRTFSFVILPAEAIPAANRYVLLLIASALSLVGIWRLKS